MLPKLEHVRNLEVLGPSVFLTILRDSEGSLYVSQSLGSAGRAFYEKHGRLGRTYLVTKTTEEAVSEYMECKTLLGDLLQGPTGDCYRVTCSHRSSINDRLETLSVRFSDLPEATLPCMKRAHEPYLRPGAVLP